MLFSGFSFAGRLLVVLTAGVFFFGNIAQAQEHVPGEVIVKFRPAASRLSLSKAGSGLKIKKNFKGRAAALVKDDVRSAEETCAEILKSGIAEDCEPNYKVYASAVPNDARFDSLWGLSQATGINAPGAWDVSTGSDSVVVGIIDTGIDYNHSDLAANVWTNPGEIAGNGRDDDSNGYVDDVHGINTMTGSGTPMDDAGHGTHVAGTIGAVSNNGAGVAGINWHVKMIGVKFLDETGSGSVADAIEGIDYLIALKRRGVNVRISNNSWGGPFYSRSLHDAVSRANDAGILFVAAAGNEGSSNDSVPSYPASYDFPNVVSVAAIDRNQNLASYSNYGSSVDIAAPGSSILSTAPGGGYATLSGTSMATPHVTGALALLQAAEPSLTNAELLQRLYDSGVALSTLNGVIRTGRTLNVARMLNNQTSPGASGPAPSSCSYSVSAFAEPANLSADSSEPLMVDQDEFNYQAVNLPFDFPFDGQKISRVFLSPNGVLYLGSAPTAIDYQPSGAAPVNSVAALHSDLVSTVRASVAGDSAVFYWTSKVWGASELGEIKMRVAIKPDGSVRQWLEFSSDEILIRSATATIGLTGSSIERAATYAAAGTGGQISREMALVYVPSCGSNGSGLGESAPNNINVSGMKLFGLKKNNKLSNALSYGGRFRARISAGPEGGAQKSGQMTFKFDNRLCPAAAQVTVRNGTFWIKGKLPKKAGYSFKKLSVQLDGARSVKKFEDPSRTRKTLSNSKFNSLCRTIAGSAR